ANEPCVPRRVERGHAGSCQDRGDSLMKTDGTAASLDRDDDEGDETVLFGVVSAGTEPADGVVDADTDPESADEDLLDPELGEFDLQIGVDDDEEFEAELLEADSDEDVELE